MTELIETAPKRELAIHDIAHLVEELRASPASYSPLFQRREPREAAHPYLQGVLAALPRKSIEPMVLAVAGVTPTAGRAMQSFLSAGRWDDEGLLPQPWQAVETDLGADDGVLRVAGRDVPQQGVHSVGVKRQYCGELGKRANCQAGVFGGSVSPQGDPVLDRRLDVPAAWRTDAVYAARRRPCGLPPELPCTTQPAWGQERLAAVVPAQTLRGRWVVADEAFGGATGFLDGVAGGGLGYCAAVSHPTRVWHERPATHVPPWRGRGRRRMGPPDDQSRQPRAQGRGVCHPASGRCTGHRARA